MDIEKDLKKMIARDKRIDESKNRDRKIGHNNSGKAGNKGCFGSSKNKLPKFNCYGF